MKRRDFFKLIGVTSGAALSACKVDNIDRKVLPYLMPPEEGIIPGIPRYVRSTCLECPAHCGLVVKLFDDHPIKLEGIPDHPINNGALCIRGQATLARLYHPNREQIKQPLIKKTDGSYHPVSWPEAGEFFRSAVNETKSKSLRNVFLSSRTTGTLNILIDEFCRAFEMERLKEVEIYNHNEIKNANRLLFGLPLLPYYRIDQCDTLVTLGVDLFETFLSPVEWGRQYAAAKTKNQFTWHHIEPYLTLTGASADHRHIINPGSEPYLLAYLIHNLKLRDNIDHETKNLLDQVPNYPIDKVSGITGLDPNAVHAVTQALEKAKQPLIISGGPAAAHINGPIAAAYTALLQWGLGMTDNTVDFEHAFNYDHVGSRDDIVAFGDACREGKIGTALLANIHGLPILKTLLETIKNIRFKVVITDRPGPLTEICDLVLPLAHFLESWGDVEPRAGIKCLVQPAILPMHHTKSEGEILLTLLSREQTYRDYLFKQWQNYGNEWRTQGYLITPVKHQNIGLLRGINLEKPTAPYRENCLFIVPSLRTFDGRGKDIALLEEIPEPMTAISYGNWLAVSPFDAREKNLANGDIVEIQKTPDKLNIPVTILPGLAPGIMQMTIDSLDAGTLISNNKFSFCLEDLKLVKTGESIKLAMLSGGKEARNRRILPFEEQHDHARHTLYPPHSHEHYRWGMVIDLDLCTGCSSCVAACYIENNVPVVGKKEHIRGREMSWLRIEPYYDNPMKPEFIPMLCQHCDYAPCEPVCPVFATYHSSEGLNTQIYNRCVGTRYCANNCPYKVRRFNWFDSPDAMPLYGTANPELLVRPKGVMEKCTFCLQRIRFAWDKAKDENRLIQDNEVIPACAQTCPTGAITFGNLMDPGANVSKLIKSAGIYRIFAQLGTEPAVYYLKRNAPGGPLFEKSGAKTLTKSFGRSRNPFSKGFRES
ncbi:MAG: 4Fe-4S dicluster domain-containing protein [Acidobacteria bacterium]|jgi:molybdopterin-containing oxidoreductase family iron-sulfur binding subunit|nr:4Fe-4S dicluster domain-containing protein [Acidobacteriota bacterium]